MSYSLDGNIKIEIENTHSRITIPFGKEYYYMPMLETIDEMTSFFVQNYEYVDAYNRFRKDGKTRVWDGKKHLFNIQDRTNRMENLPPKCFLTGKIFEVVSAMKKYGVVPEIIDKRKRPLEKNLETIWNEEFVMRDYQKVVVEEAVKKSRGIIKSCTGSGKTIMISRIIHEIGVKPVIVLVTTKDLLYQGKETYEKTLQIPIGVIGDGKCEIQDVNVCTVQTAMIAIGKKKEYKEYLKAFNKQGGESSKDKEKLIEDEDKIHKIHDFLKEAQVVIFDEVQHAPSSVAREVLEYCSNAFYRFGLSATPERDDGEEMTIEGLFGRYICEISASELIRKGYLVKPTIFFIPVNNDSFEPYENWQEEYMDCIVEHRERNDIIISITNSLIEKGLSTLVLVKQIRHGELLESSIPNSVFIDGRKSTKKRLQAIDDLRNRKIPCLISTTLADEGLDLPTLDALVLAGGGKSRTKAYQRIGRVLRKSPGKEHALVYDFADRSPVTRKHYRARRGIYKLEEEFEIIEMKKKVETNKPKAKKII